MRNPRQTLLPPNLKRPENQWCANAPEKATPTAIATLIVSGLTISIIHQYVTTLTNGALQARTLACHTFTTSNTITVAYVTAIHTHTSSIGKSDHAPTNRPIIWLC